MSNPFEKKQPEKVFDPQLREGMEAAEELIMYSEEELQFLYQELEDDIFFLETNKHDLEFTKEMSEDPDLNVPEEDVEKIEERIDKLEKDINKTKDYIARTILDKVKFQAQIDNFKDLERRAAELITRLRFGQNN